MAPKDDVPGDGLIQGGGLQAIGARKVQEPIGPAAGGANETAFLALHGHAGVVGHLLTAAGEAVEQRRLAAVGNPDER